MQITSRNMYKWSFNRRIATNECINASKNNNKTICASWNKEQVIILSGTGFCLAEDQINAWKQSRVWFQVTMPLTPPTPNTDVMGQEGRQCLLIIVHLLYTQSCWLRSSSHKFAVLSPVFRKAGFACGMRLSDKTFVFKSFESILQSLRSNEIKQG